MLAVLRSARADGIALKPLVASAFALEFAAGACNALDEYSSFLTPGNLALAQSVLRGKMVGVGMEVGVVEDRLQVTRIYQKGPAHEAGLSKSDRILRIAGQSVEKLPAEAVADRLRGEPGSTVEVEVRNAASRTAASTSSSAAPSLFPPSSTRPSTCPRPTRSATCASATSPTRRCRTCARRSPR